MPCRNEAGIYSITAYSVPPAPHRRRRLWDSSLPDQLRTQLQSASCKKSLFEHSTGAGQPGFLLLIPGSASDSLGILQEVSKLLYGSVSLSNSSANLLT